jgi:hypothetical protein
MWGAACLRVGGEAAGELACACLVEKCNLLDHNSVKQRFAHPSHHLATHTPASDVSLRNTQRERER